MHTIAADKEPVPVRTIEEVEVKDADRTGWEAFCGKYEKPDDDLFVDQVFMRDGELFARLIEKSRAWEAKLYPLGGNEFGIKRYSLAFKFGDGSLCYGGYTCKML